MSQSIHSLAISTTTSKKQFIKMINKVAQEKPNDSDSETVSNNSNDRRSFNRMASASFADEMKAYVRKFRIKVNPPVLPQGRKEVLQVENQRALPIPEDQREKRLGGLGLEPGEGDLLPPPGAEQQKSIG